VGSIYDENDEDEVTSILQPSKHLGQASYRPKLSSEPRVELNGPTSIPERRTMPSLPSMTPASATPVRERPVQVSLVEATQQGAYSRPSVPQLQMTPSFTTLVKNKLSAAWQALSSSLRNLAPRYRIMAFAGLAAVVTIVLFAVLIPRSGNLDVTVAGPGNTKIEDFSVYVDDVPLSCSNTGCRAPDLKAGTHYVRAEAPGYEATAQRAVVVLAGNDVAYNFALKPKVPPKANLEVGAGSVPIRIFVDDAAFGLLPVSLSELEPKSHQIRFEGGERYEPSEQRITLKPGETARLNPPALKPKPTKLNLSLSEGSEGAIVIVDGTANTLPATLSMDPLVKHQITATLAGYNDFTYESRFDQALEENLEIAMERASATGSPTQSSTPAKAKAAEPAPALATYATLNLNSLPPAAAFVNGQAAGSTPRLGVRVRSGQNSILFIHPTKGRKQVVVSLTPGETRTVAVRF
jgi:serine/threonine-protein kinase